VQRKLARRDVPLQILRHPALDAARKAVPAQENRPRRRARHPVALVRPLQRLERDIPEQPLVRVLQLPFRDVAAFAARKVQDRRTRLRTEPLDQNRLDPVVEVPKMDRRVVLTIPHRLHVPRDPVVRARDRKHGRLSLTVAMRLIGQLSKNTIGFATHSSISLPVRPVPFKSSLQIAFGVTCPQRQFDNMCDAILSLNDKERRDRLLINHMAVFGLKGERRAAVNEVD
jgi:hypothetical protein